MASLPESVPEVAGVKRLSLRPGDRLVLSVEQRLTDEDYARLRDDVNGWGLPEGVKVIVLDGGSKLQVLVREDA